MPLLTGDVSEFAKGDSATIPQAQPQTPQAMPSGLEVADAAVRTSNLLGTAYDRLTNPKPESPSEPGFDPLVSVPHGYEQYADRFLWAKNPDDMEWERQAITRELGYKQTIARAGGWGVAASMAAGLTDPVTIASMAIPMGGETRLANAVRLAAVNAGTSAVQELGTHALSETRTGEESALNIGASAILGGILGPLAKRVPKAELDRLHAGLQTDGALGPATSSIIDDRLKPPPPPPAEASYMSKQIREALATHEANLTEAATGAEAQKSAGLDVGEVQGRLQQGITEQNRLADLIKQDRGAMIKQEVDRLANGPGVLESLRRRYNMADVSSVLERKAAQSVDAERANWNDLKEIADEDVAKARGQMESIAKKQSAEIDLEQLQHGMRNAQGLSDLAQLLPEGQRAAFERRIGQLPVPTEFRPIDRLEPAETGLPVQETPNPQILANPSESQSFGAAAAQGNTLKGMTVAKGAKTLVEGPGRVAPGNRLISSLSLKSRELLENLVNVGPVLEKNMEGKANAVPIERLLWRHEGTWQQAADARSAAFRAYRERLAGKSYVMFPPRTEGAMTRSEFNKEITYAMRRGDQHEIPEVAQAARDTRKLVFDPLYERAKALGILPEEARLHAQSYVMRQYDAKAIRADQAGWHQTLVKHFMFQGADLAEANDIAHAATRNVLGAERGTMDWKMLDGVVPESGRLKERTLTVPDELLEPYLNNDIDHLTHSYIRSLAPEVEMQDRFGSRDLADQIADIKDEYAVLKQRALAAGDNDKANDLDKALSNDLRDVTAIRDRLYGVYGQPKDPGAWYIRAARLARTENVLRLLGGATISHIPDIANVITRYGMTNTFSAIGKLASSMEAMQLTRNEAHRLGAALDMAMNTISVLGDFGSHSQYVEQRIAGKLSRAFTMVTGETPLVSVVQAVASAIGQDEILRAAETVGAGKAIDKNLAIRLAQSGLDQEMLQRISGEVATHGREVNGLKFGMSDQWADQEAARTFETAILKDAHGMTLRPSVADTPLLMSNELGKTVGQFKTFAFAAQNAVINPIAQGIARGDPRAVAGLLTLAGAGAMSYMIKQTRAGQPIEFDNPGRFALEVLDKSNLLGWTGEAIYPALWQFGFKDLSRWSDRDPIETLLGPTAGTLTSTYNRRIPAKLLGDQTTADNTMTRSDLHFMRRTFLPGQNLWYARKAINGVEDYIGDAFDLPGVSNEQRAAMKGE
jgi:hypothetical protein